MKPDKLEKYMLDNKDGFDLYEPDEGMWEKIQKRSKPVRKINFRRIAWQAAAGAAIFLASWLINDLVQQNNNDFAGVENQYENPTDENMKVLMEAEVFYASKIQGAREEIIQLSGHDKELISMLDFDLVELDEVFQELKNDLKDNGDNQEVIEAMIQNYRLKLEILEEMLLQLNRMNNHDEKLNGHEI